MHVEFETPAIQYVATRDLREPYLLSGGDPLPRVGCYSPDRVAEYLEDMGLAVVRDGRRMFVMAGTCDVERPWRRARSRTCAEHTRWHAETAERIRTRLARDAERKARRAEARAAAARADDDECVINVRF